MHFENQRRSPRIDNPGHLKGVLADGQLNVTILEMSRHGFSMYLERDCTAGELLDIQFWSDSYASIILTARVVHVMRWRDSSEGLKHLAGLEFVGHDTQPVQDIIEALIAHLQGPVGSRAD